jgi:hypothetical protein
LEASNAPHSDLGRNDSEYTYSLCKYNMSLRFSFKIKKQHLHHKNTTTPPTHPHEDKPDQV